MLVLVVSSIVGAVSKFLWGYIIDKINYKTVIIISLVLGGIFTLILPFVSSDRFGFMVCYTMLTVCERGFLTIGPPILVKIFGIEHGT